MAKLYITQYARQGRTDRGAALVGEEPNLGTIIADTAVNGGVSVLLHTASRLVRLYADAAIVVKVAPENDAGVVGTVGVPIGAGVAEYLYLDERMTAGGLKFSIAAIGSPAASTVPTITISSVQPKAERSDGAVTMYNYTVTRSAAVGPINVRWWFAPGATLGVDFVGDAYPAGGWLEFLDGELTKTIAIAVKGENLFEQDEVFTIGLVVPKGYTAGAATTATGTILNDDAEIVAPAPAPAPAPAHAPLHAPPARSRTLCARADPC